MSKDEFWTERVAAIVRETTGRLIRCRAEHILHGMQKRSTQEPFFFPRGEFRRFEGDKRRIVGILCRSIVVSTVPTCNDLLKISL